MPEWDNLTDAQKEMHLQAQKDALVLRQKNIDKARAERSSQSEAPQRPTICRMVVYRSRTGNYSVPAVVNCTSDSIYPPGVEAGFVPPLSGPMNVHLTVFTPGRPGQRRIGAKVDHPFNGVVTCLNCGKVREEHTHDPFLNPSQYPVSENVAGCYQEWDVAYDP